MGNELSVNPVSSNTAASYTTMPVLNNFGLGNTGSIFNTAMNGKSYANDMLMPDFLKTGVITEEQRAAIFGPMYLPQAQPGNTNIQNDSYMQNQTAGTNNILPQIPNPQSDTNTNEQLYQKIIAQDPNIKIPEKVNDYKPSDIGKKAGLFGGILTGLGSEIAKIFKGSKPFSIKSMAIKLPVLGIAGWAIGSIIDSFVNASKAHNA